MRSRSCSPTKSPEISCEDRSVQYISTVRSRLFRHTACPPSQLQQGYGEGYYERYDYENREFSQSGSCEHTSPDHTMTSVNDTLDMPNATNSTTSSTTVSCAGMYTLSFVLISQTILHDCISFQMSGCTILSVNKISLCFSLM